MRERDRHEFAPLFDVVRSVEELQSVGSVQLLEQQPHGDLVGEGEPEEGLVRGADGQRPAAAGGVGDLETLPAETKAVINRYDFADFIERVREAGFAQERDG